MTAEHVKHLAHQLAERLKEDIHRAANREEHIRVSARANEAHLLLEGLNQIFYEGTDENEATEENG